MRLTREFFYILAAVLLMLPATSLAADPSAAGTTSVIVTVEAHKGSTAPALRQGDVMMYQKRDRLAVSGVTALAGAPTELYVVIDEAIGPNFGTQLTEVKKFITEQPANTSIGVAYMHDGTVDIPQKPTTDHAAAAKALRLPTPGLGTSAFESVTELLKQWPQTHARREMVLMSSGIEPFGPVETTNPFVDDAVAAVQRQGIPVFGIYLQPMGHWGHTYWRQTWAQTYLSRLSDESGGEGYNMVGNTVVTVAPFLADINQRLQNQYRVAFTPNATEKPGFVPIRAETEVPKIDLVTQDRVWVGDAQ